MDTRARLPALDLARGIALIGMVTFHLVFDLELFGQLPPGTIATPFWSTFARTVAGSFVLLAGVSLVLAQGTGLRPRAFARSTLLLALAALAVSLATWVAMPQFFVFFGILHAIALFRLLGLGLVRAPAWLLAAAGLGIWAAGLTLAHPAFDSRWLAWIGFSERVPMTVDLLPVFPWLGPFLLGMAAARLGWAPRWPVRGRVALALARAGRHSLAIYLLHQPILLGVLWLAFAPH